MNTEDSEFKRIEAEAKRRAQEDDDDTQVYASDVALAVMQEAKPPEWPLIKNILDEYGLDAIAFVAEWKAAQRKPLTDKDILANETLRYYFGQNGGAGPVSKQGRKVVDAIEAAHGIKETEK